MSHIKTRIQFLIYLTDKRDMKRLAFSSQLATLLLIGISLLMTACMPKVEDGSEVEEVTITSHEIERNGANSKIILHGTCPMATNSYRVNVEEIGLDVYGPSITSWADASGIPVGTCTAGVLNIQYPVPNPTQGRLIQFRVKAKLADGKLSLYPALRDVLYDLPSLGIPGFAVTSGGGFDTTAGDVKLHASVGIVHAYVPTPSTGTLFVPGSSASLRAGLQGILYDDTL